MQVQQRITQTSGPYPQCGIYTGKNRKLRSRRKTENIEVRRPTPGFLTFQFEEKLESENHSLFNRKNYIHLYESAKNFLRLIGLEFNHTPDYKDFGELLMAFRYTLPDEYNCSFYEEEDTGKLFFEVWEDTLPTAVYFLPLFRIRKCYGKMRHLLVSFLRLFQYTQHWDMLEDDSEYACIVSEYDSNYDIEDDPEYYKYLRSYNKGAIRHTIELLRDYPVMDAATLYREFREFKPRKKINIDIKEYVLWGLELLMEDQTFYDHPRHVKVQRQYTNLFDFENCVLASQTFKYVYRCDDRVSEDYHYILNETWGDNLNDIIPSNYFIISPTMESIPVNDYPVRFTHWLDCFIWIMSCE